MTNNITQFPKKDWVDEAFKKDKKPYKVTHLSQEEKEAELIEQMHRS